MTQEEFDNAPLLDQILYDETGMLVDKHPSIAKAMEKYHQAKLKLLGIGGVSNPLPTKEEVIAEGNKQIEDWLSENHYKEQRAYRVAFRRSYEYVLRFIK